MTFQPNIPLATDLISVSQTDIKNNFSAIGTTFDVNHVDFNASGAGKHKFAEFPNQGSDPVGAGNEMTLFSKLIAGASQLFYKRNNAVTSFQLTGADPLAAANGSTFLPGGLILKWGTYTLAAGTNSTPVVFAGGAFPTNCFSLTITGNITNNKSMPSYSGLTTVGFNGNKTDVGFATTYTYIAIGK